MKTKPQSAFPIPPANGGTGMTLRDYFAAKALACMSLPSHHWTDNENYWKGVAECAYTAADAMLAARAKGEQP